MSENTRFTGLAHPSQRVHYDVVRSDGSLEMEDVTLKLNSDTIGIIDNMGMNHKEIPIKWLHIDETGTIRFSLEVFEFRKDMRMEMWKAWRPVTLRPRV